VARRSAVPQLRCDTSSLGPKFKAESDVFRYLPLSPAPSHCPRRLHSPSLQTLILQSLNLHFLFLQILSLQTLIFQLPCSSLLSLNPSLLPLNSPAPLLHIFPLEYRYPSSMFVNVFFNLLPFLTLVTQNMCDRLPSAIYIATCSLRCSPFAGICSIFLCPSIDTIGLCQSTAYQSRRPLPPRCWMVILFILVFTLPNATRILIN